jgi:hypothetical protein
MSDDRLNEAWIVDAHKAGWEAYAEDQRNPGIGLVPDPQDNVAAAMTAAIRAYLDHSSSNNGRKVEVTGPYLYRTDQHPSLRVTIDDGRHLASISIVDHDMNTAEEAAEALKSHFSRSALEPSPAQPVAWLYRDSLTKADDWDVTTDPKEADAIMEASREQGGVYEVRPLYPSPAPKIAPAAEGWKLVPRAPTDVMMQAGLYQASADAEWGDVYSSWVDMWDVAPASPSPAPVEAPLKRYAWVKLTGSVTLLPVVREDGEWVTFADVADLCAANQRLRRAAQPGAQNNDVVGEAK